MFIVGLSSYYTSTLPTTLYIILDHVSMMSTEHVLVIAVALLSKHHTTTIYIVQEHQDIPTRMIIHHDPGRCIYHASNSTPPT